MPPKSKTSTKKNPPVDGKDEKGKFKKGNLFWLSCTANNGRPPVFKTPTELMEKIAEYLDWEDSQKRPDSFNGGGKGIYTLSGCALFLGFSSRSSMDDQAKRSSEFSDVINKFKQFMVHWNEQKLYWGGSFMAGQFWLKNHGNYKDEQTVNQNVVEYKTKWAVPDNSAKIVGDKK
ncbi:MAG: terminase small subunit [Bacteroidia bacterium]